MPRQDGMFFHSWARIGHVMLAAVVVFAIVVLRASSASADEISGDDSAFAQPVGSDRLP